MDKSVHLVHRGKLHFQATSGSGHIVLVDDVVDNRGPEPMEYVLVALGSCGGMDVASILAKKRQRVLRHEVTVMGRQRGEHPRTFSNVTLIHYVEGPELDAEAVRRAIELSATSYCPVNAMLAAGKVTIEHRYVARSETGESAGQVVVTGPNGAGLAGR